MSTSDVSFVDTYRSRKVMKFNRESVGYARRHRRRVTGIVPRCDAMIASNFISRRGIGIQSSKSAIRRLIQEIIARNDCSTTIPRLAAEPRTRRAGTRGVTRFFASPRVRAVTRASSPYHSRRASPPINNHLFTRCCSTQTLFNVSYSPRRFRRARHARVR